MTSHDWFEEHRVFFVARTLAPEEESLFREHLPGCEACRTEVARLARDLAWLPMGVEPVPPRPGLRRRLAEGALGQGRGRWNRASRAAMAAGLLLGVAGYLVGRGAGDARARAAAARADSAVTAVAALADTLSIMRGAARVVQASVEMDGARGGMLIFADETTHRWNVVLHGLPPAGPTHRYMFWFICEDGMVRGAELQPDLTRPAFFTTGMPERRGRVMGAALTLEPMLEDSDSPKGKELAHLIL